MFDFQIIKVLQTGGITMKRLALLLLSLVATISGCASITQGTTQTLIFSIEPKEARCIATRVDDGQLGVVTQAQNTLQVGKDKDDIIVTCNAAGYKPYSQRIVSGATGAGVAGAIFIDLGITDMITGAMWKYPESHNISMEKEGSTPAVVSTPKDIAQTEQAEQK